MSTASPIVTLKHVGVSYHKGRNPFKRQQYWALKDISFDLYPGETLGIIGRNGAGKSTLLKLLAGILLPNRGEIIGRDYTTSLLSLQVGFVQHLTGRENAILSALLLGVDRRVVENNMNAIIDFAALGEFFDEPLSSYSTGMRARLGFAVALYADPDILLIDEVLGVGDQAFREKSTAAMREKISSDKTIVIVSHNPGLIADFCDRAVLIENGKSVAVGAPKEILTEYQ